METRTRAKSRYFIVTQLTIKNAPQRILVKVGSDEGDDWRQFQDNNTECNIDATYEEVGPVRSPQGAYRLFLDGIGTDRAQKQALSNLTHEQLVELALSAGCVVEVHKLEVSEQDKCGLPRNSIKAPQPCTTQIKAQDANGVD
jgi:hypothetical protein